MDEKDDFAGRPEDTNLRLLMVAGEKIYLLLYLLSLKHVPYEKSNITRKKIVAEKTNKKTEFLKFYDKMQIDLMDFARSLEIPNATEKRYSASLFYSTFLLKSSGSFSDDIEYFVLDKLEDYKKKIVVAEEPEF